MTHEDYFMVWARMGFKTDPFHAVSIETADGARVANAVEMACASEAMLVVAGPRGIGKSRAVGQALPKDAQQVWVYRLRKERLHIGDIEEALIDEVSAENARRGGEARARQLRRVLGEASRQTRVVLVLDDAHWLHGLTLRALKRLRELAWMGRSPLLTVILLAHRDPMATPGLDEVRLRSHRVWMEGLAQGEALDYARQTVGRAWAPDALEAVAATPAARNWLDYQESLNKCMAAAVAEGRTRVEVIDVVQAVGAGLRELARSLDVSLGELAEATGKSRSQVSRVLAGEREDAAARDAIEKVLRGKMGNGQQKREVG